MYRALVVATSLITADEGGGGGGHFDKDQTLKYYNITQISFFTGERFKKLFSTKGFSTRYCHGTTTRHQTQIAGTCKEAQSLLINNRSSMLPSKVNKICLYIGIISAVAPVLNACRPLLLLHSDLKKEKWIAYDSFFSVMVVATRHRHH